MWVGGDGVATVKVGRDGEFRMILVEVLLSRRGNSFILDGVGLTRSGVPSRLVNKNAQNL